MTRALPTGTVTFLFTDIEGSTRLLQDLGDVYEHSLGAHRELLRGAVSANRGHEVDTEGDGFLFAFSRATDAVAAALDGQRALAGHPWPAEREVRVRMGLHTGEAQLVDDDYVGLAVHQASRICAAAHGGQVLVSQATGELVAEGLPGEAKLVDLGEHRLKDLARPSRLYNLAHASLRAEVPPPRTLSVLPNNLPLQLTTFIGRDAEIERLRKLLAETRLFTLAGAGGSGKTRLALQLAAECVTEYRDGVWLADLAPITDPDLVMRGIAEAVGVREEKERPIEVVLVEFLQGKELLVVVDNCEHLAEACAEVIDRLLHATAGLRVVATSREPLGADGESVFRVPSLSLPRDDDPPESLAASEAVRLFCDRAAMAAAGFCLTPETAPPIAEVCRRLDGMPLAIELAAARVRMLTPQEIARRLDDRFKLLTGGLRTGIRRQQTLRATVDWSYEMLTEAERQLFRRLSVFVGGFTLEAAEGVSAGDGIEDDEVFDLLSNLVDRSLVVAEPAGDQTRYRLLETMREYGREALVSSGEAQDVWSKHLGWFAGFGETAGAGLVGAEQGPWLARIETELENVRQALSWATSGGDPADGLRLAASLYWFWHYRWYPAEGFRWLTACFEACDDLPAPLLANGLMAMGFCAWQKGDVKEALIHYERCVAIPRTPETIRKIAEATNDLGILTWGMHGDMPRAVALLENALELRRETGDVYGQAETTGNLAAFAAFGGNFGGARDLYTQALELYRSVGAKANIGHVLAQVGTIAEQMGRTDEALQLHREALELRREVGDRHGVAASLESLASLARRRGDFDRAESLVHEAMAGLGDDESGWGLDAARHQLGLLALARGGYGEAGALFEQVHESTRRVGSDGYTAIAAVSRAQLHLTQGRLAEARAGYEGALDVLRRFNDIADVATVLAFLAQVCRRSGDLRSAAGYIDEGLSLARGQKTPYTEAALLHELGMLRAAGGEVEAGTATVREALATRHRLALWPDVAVSVESLGRLEAARASGEQAAVLLGSAEGLRRRIGTVIHPVDRDEHDGAIEAARAAAGDTFGAAWEQGLAMSPDEAVAAALAEPPG